MRVRGFRRVGAGAAALVCVALVTAACGNSGSDSGTATSGSNDTAALLGPVKQATGTPIKIGYVGDGTSPALDNSSDIPAAQAAVQYVNQHLGGIAGRPVQLVTCETKSTPSGGSDCGSQMVDAQVAAVLENTSGQTGQLVRPVNAAGIPFLVDENADAAVLSAQHGYILPNVLYAFATPAKLAKLDGAKRAGVISIDVPSTTQSLRTLGNSFYQKAGVPLDIVPVAPGVADMTPQIQTELAKNPDQLYVIGNASFCTAALKAMKTLGYNKTIVMVNQCIDKSGAQAIPGGYAGMKTIGVKDNDPSTPAYKLYQAVMKTYAPNLTPTSITPGSYTIVVGFARAMSGLTGEITPATVEKTLNAMAPQPYPLAPFTFQCNRQQIPITPAICSTGTLVGTLDKEGKPAGGYQMVDVADLVK